MSERRVLVVGATGQLGGAIARQLLAAGVPVRALARNRTKLEPLAALGAEIAPVDLLDQTKLNEACKGIDQVVSTANNNMGAGPTSPGRIDLTAHQNLCAAVRNARIRRLMYVSFRGVEPGESVDIFRLKWYIEDAIRRSGVPYVMLRPTAFMDVWVDHIIADRVRKKGGALVFGDGTAVANYIAVEDVATFAVRILAADSIINEAIEVGGPSNTSLNDLATLVEQRLGATGRRKHVPVLMMKLLPPIVRPFNEVAARLMTLGHYAATRTKPFPNWRESAERFGVTPRTVEAYIDAMPDAAGR
ncbi:MAG TPA: SDR family oxidoreductase [Vicinamibacterales bacterium]|nr:SDR family oxidoreductase [Vicinamibacterales bacterium]